MSNFKKPKPRFDRAYANDGIWVYPVDNVGNDYGGFRIGLFDRSIPRVKVAIERQERLNSAAARSKRVGDATDATVRQNVEMFIDASLLDWDMTGDDGEKIPFTKARAIEYFLQTEINEETGEKDYIYDYPFGKLFDASRNADNFQSDEQTAAGDPLGN